MYLLKGELGLIKKDNDYILPFKDLSQPANIQTERETY